MKGTPVKRALLIVAAIIGLAIPTATVLTVADGAPAEAAVTNCGKTYPSIYDVIGRCYSTTAYAPYTTRFALMLQCTNGHTYTSGLVTVGQWPYTAYVKCGGGSRVSSWFLFA